MLCLFKVIPFNYIEAIILGTTPAETTRSTVLSWLDSVDQIPRNYGKKDKNRDHTLMVET